MPTVLRVGPYDFFFFSNERQEPPHIHIERDEDEVKFWLNPVRLAVNHGFRQHEVNTIEQLVEQHEALLLEKWNEHFAR